MLGRRLLLYVVIDMSLSMSQSDEAGKTKIQTAMEIIPSVIETAKKHATIAASLRVAVIGFNQSVEELFLPDERIGKHDIRSLESWWESSKESVLKKCSGKTCFSWMFRKLNEIITRDQEEYQESYIRMDRPVVYLLTDGRWEEEVESREEIKESLMLLRSELDGKKAPEIFSIGIGDDVNQDNILEYAAGRKVRQWSYDKEKDRRVLEFSNGEYKCENESMAFIFKGDKAAYKLRAFNNAVLRSSLVRRLIKIECESTPGFSINFDEAEPL